MGREPIDNNKSDDIHAQVLLIDDQRTVVKGIQQLVKDASDINFHSCTDPREAIKVANHFGPTVFLLDIHMPEIDGFELLNLIKADPAICDVPIIMLSANERPETKEKAFTLGADDYLVKVPDKIELIARIRYHTRAYMNHLERAAAYRELEDSRKQLETALLELERLSTLDSLTNIDNRRQLDNTMAREWQRSMRSSTPISFIMIDIDHFKQYNDCYGHVDGDHCLAQVAKSLADTLKRPTDHIARYGGEEFAVILPDTDAAGANIIAEYLRQSIIELDLKHSKSETADVVTISLGISSCVPEKASEYEGLIAVADRALYQSKEHGRNQTTTLACSD